MKRIATDAGDSGSQQEVTAVGNIPRPSALPIPAADAGELRAWLDRGRLMDKEIEQMLLAKEALFSQACGTSGSVWQERVQAGRENRSERKLISLIRLGEAIDRRIDELVSVREQILAAVSALPDPLLRTLLIARYINFQGWEQIAEDMNYSQRHITRLHGKALNALLALGEQWRQSG